MYIFVVLLKKNVEIKDIKKNLLFTFYRTGLPKNHALDDLFKNDISAFDRENALNGSNRRTNCSISSRWLFLDSLLLVSQIPNISEGKYPVLFDYKNVPFTQHKHGTNY